MSEQVNSGNKVSTTGAASRLSPRTLRRLGWSALIVVLFLVLLPEGIRLGLIQAAPELGLGEAQIDDVDLNLFSGSAGVDGLVLTREDETKLSLNAVAVDISWLKLVLGEIHIETASIDGLEVTARQLPEGHWEVVIPLISETEAAVSTEPEEVTDEPLELPRVLLSQMSVSNTRVSVQSELVNGDFTVDSLLLEHVSTWQDTPLIMELQGHWRDAPMALMVSAQPWIEQPEVKGELVLEALPLAGIDVIADATLQGALSAQLDFSGQLTPDGIRTSLQGQLGLEELAASYRSLGVQQQQLSWQGNLALMVPTVDEATLAYELHGDVASAGLQLRDDQQDVTLLSWQALALEGLVVNQTLGLELEQLHLTAANVLDKNLQTGELLIDKVQLQQANALRIESVQLNRGDYSVVLDEQGQLRAETVIARTLEGLGQTSAADEVAPSAEAESTTESESLEAQPFRFSLESLTIAGDTQLSFVDQRFAEPFTQQLVINELTVTSLDQFNPDQQTTLSLRGRVGEFSTLVVDGEGRFFAEPMSTSIKGKLSGMELPELSPYSAAFIGYELTRGHYDHEFSVVIEKEEIDLKNELYLRQLALQSVDPDTPQPLERQMDVPLGVALDMLRDGDDNIHLEVPIHGRLDDPDININDIVNDALSQALKKGATSYLAFALQPYGAILMAAEMVGDQMTAVRLEPLTYSPGEADVPEQRDYLDKLRGLLDERPKLHLSICGRSNGEDRRTLFGGDTDPQKESAEPAINSEQQKALQQLAEQRAKNLKRLFVAEGLKGERVLLCQAKYEEKGVSGVQLQM